MQRLDFDLTPELPLIMPTVNSLPVQRYSNLSHGKIVNHDIDFMNDNIYQALVYSGDGCLSSFLSFLRVCICFIFPYILPVLRAQTETQVNLHNDTQRI
jgi:hypothetical protein